MGCERASLLETWLGSQSPGRGERGFSWGTAGGIRPQGTRAVVIRATGRQKNGAIPYICIARSFFGRIGIAGTENTVSRKTRAQPAAIVEPLGNHILCRTSQPVGSPLTDAPDFSVLQFALCVKATISATQAFLTVVITTGLGL